MSKYVSQPPFLLFLSRTLQIVATKEHIGELSPRHFIHLFRIPGIHPTKSRVLSSRHETTELETQTPNRVSTVQVTSFKQYVAYFY